MWSLSIEEQCYLLLPLALLAGWALGRRRGVTIVVVALTACSLAAAWWFADDPMRVYYGTDVRAAEVLIGALGALAVTTRMAPHLRRACAALAPAAILLIGWSWTAASETSPALAHGGLALHAVATLIVIVALSQPGWLTGAFAVAPLVWLGRISYGVYLYHWPLFLWLTPARTGLSDGWNDVLRVGATLALATLSFHVLELPIQRMRIAPRPTLAVGAMAIAGDDDRGRPRHAGTRSGAVDRHHRRAAGAPPSHGRGCRTDIASHDGGRTDVASHRTHVAAGRRGCRRRRTRADADPDGGPRRYRPAALRLARYRRRAAPARRASADHPRCR